MVGHALETHRTQIDGIVMPDAVEAVARHHLARARVILANPGTLVPLEGNAATPAGFVEHPDAFGHHLLTDSVAGNQRNLIVLHCTLPCRLRLRTVHDAARILIVYRAERQSNPFS